MRQVILGFTVAPVIMVVMTLQAVAGGFPIQKASVTLAQTPAHEAPLNSRRGPNVVDETSSTASPQDYFRKARDRFLKNDISAAAAEIRKVARLLKLKAVGATEKTKAALIASSHELETLARGIEKGTVTSTQDLRRAFAHAERALGPVVKDARATATKPTKGTGWTTDQVNQELNEG